MEERLSGTGPADWRWKRREWVTIWETRASSYFGGLRRGLRSSSAVREAADEIEEIDDRTRGGC